MLCALQEDQSLEGRQAGRFEEGRESSKTYVSGLQMIRLVAFFSSLASLACFLLQRRGTLAGDGVRVLSCMHPRLG